VVKRFASLAVCTALLVACGQGGSSDPSTSAPNSVDIESATSRSSLPFEPKPLEWKGCNGVECAELEVPRDYFAQTSATFTLKLERQRALKPEERIGVLLVNPGGPGVPGSSLAQNAAYYFSRDVLDHFDIVAWDPRGTGESTPAVDCIDKYDDYFRQPLTADSAKSFIDGCVQRSGAILEHIGTVDSARDMETIRRALGEKQVSYFGFSYGGVLGLVWQSMFPSTVRASVLDAPPSPIASRGERIAGQARAFERVLNEFLKKNNVTSTFDDLTASPPEGLTKHMIVAAAVSALYDEESWPELADALNAAKAGDATKITALYRGYYYQDAGYEDYRNTFEASAAIACFDDTQRAPLGDISSFAPRLASFFASDELCSQWPAKSKEKYSFRGSMANPTVIVGATEDPASPFVGVQAAASVAGNVRLITVDARRHTSYLYVDCVTKLVDDYLIKLAPPPNATCISGTPPTSSTSASIE
jgi:pimeloyl-ACP methyl ester carboxylesterase